MPNIKCTWLSLQKLIIGYFTKDYFREIILDFKIYFIEILRPISTPPSIPINIPSDILLDINNPIKKNKPPTTNKIFFLFIIFLFNFLPPNKYNTHI